MRVHRQRHHVERRSYVQRAIQPSHDRQLPVRRKLRQPRRCRVQPEFTGNSTTFNGGAVFSNASSPTITACTFVQNTAGNLGGAMMNHYYSETTVTNCSFIGNQAGGRGGAVRSGVAASPTFANCTFSQNSAVESGGALAAGSGQDVAPGNTLLVNCVLWENTAPQGSEL
ncbi:MAG: right-handed parallel beta-helix repeat-containing protein, partial [Planctomycetota bacterium]